MLVSVDGTSDEIADYQDQLGVLASHQRMQPYNLYPRPFKLLNIAPDL